jgi:hypothetical protein
MSSGGMFDFLVRLVVTFDLFSQIFFISDISKLDNFELPEMLVFGKGSYAFVFFFKMHFHEVLTDGGFGFRAHGALNWHIRTRRGCA